MKSKAEAQDVAVSLKIDFLQNFWVKIILTRTILKEDYVSLSKI
ncbi:MAG: hypothetical protein WC782_10930 [Methylococcaceae bacterium]